MFVVSLTVELHPYLPQEQLVTFSKSKGTNSNSTRILKWFEFIHCYILVFPVLGPYVDNVVGFIIFFNFRDCCDSLFAIRISSQTSKLLS